MSGIEEAFADASLSDSQLEQPTLDLDGYQAIMWYGISSIIHAFLALVIYLIFNYDPVIRTYKEVMLSHQFAYWPVAIGWAAIALFDSDFTRELYKATIGLSVLGPFAGHIVGFVFLFINSDNTNTWDWYMWLVWPFYLVYVVVQMLIQFMLLPEIYDYLDFELFEGVAGLVQ